MRRMIIIGIAAFSGSTISAQAADLGGEEDVAAIYGSATVWAGLYAGGSVGYGWGDASDTVKLVFDPASAGTGSIREDSDDLNGVIYGAHLGYNFQHGNFVFGPEIGFNGTAMNAATLEYDLGGNPIEHDLDWYASAVGRLGYAHKQFLFYGIAGMAWGRVQTDFPNAANLEDAEDTTTFVGWTAGAGIEYALSDRFSLRLEYAHVDLGSEKNFNERSAITPNVDIIVTNETDIEFDVVKIGASYRLGDRHEPLK